MSRVCLFSATPCQAWWVGHEMLNCRIKAHRRSAIVRWNFFLSIPLGGWGKWNLQASFVNCWNKAGQFCIFESRRAISVFINLKGGYFCTFSLKIKEVLLVCFQRPNRARWQTKQQRIGQWLFLTEQIRTINRLKGVSSSCLKHDVSMTPKRSTLRIKSTGCPNYSRVVLNDGENARNSVKASLLLLPPSVVQRSQTTQHWSSFDWATQLSPHWGHCENQGVKKHGGLA